MPLVASPSLRISSSAAMLAIRCALSSAIFCSAFTLIVLFPCPPVRARRVVGFVAGGDRAPDSFGEPFAIVRPAKGVAQRLVCHAHLVASAVDHPQQAADQFGGFPRSEEHTSELQSPKELV